MNNCKLRTTCILLLLSINFVYCMESTLCDYSFLSKNLLYVEHPPSRFYTIWATIANLHQRSGNGPVLLPTSLFILMLTILLYCCSSSMSYLSLTTTFANGYIQTMGHQHLVQPPYPTNKKSEVYSFTPSW